MIGVALATRGLVHTQVLEALEVERAFHDLRVYYSHDLPIPDAQNYLIDELLQDEKVIGEFSHIFFVEEDTVPPVGVLGDLISADSDIAFVDYSVSGWSCSAKDRADNLLWCGLGCTLVKRDVFDKLEKPFFRSDKSLKLNNWKWVDVPMKYGGHDIWFMRQALEAGCTIKQVEGECDHLEIKELGQREVNNGLHNIQTKLKIAKQQIIERS